MTTTTADALLRSILSAPDDDLPRLVYADFLEESGEDERAWFIRNQLSPDYRRDWEMTPKARTKMTREQLVHTTAVPGLHLVGWDNDAVCYSPEDRWPSVHRIDVTFSRGFPDSLTCSWQDFERDGEADEEAAHAVVLLRIHESLIWSPTQTVECRCRGEYGEWNSAHCRYRCESYPCNPKTGRIPRPFVNTAQPLESVRLTTWPGGISQPAYTGSFQIDGETRFDRVKCVTCDGRDYSPNMVCPDCHGTPSNRWTCSAWPGIVVEMPNVGT